MPGVEKNRKKEASVIGVDSRENGTRKKERFGSSTTLSSIIVNFQVLRFVQYKIYINF